MPVELLDQAGFDFDEMARLARDDPAGFAQRREQLIARVLAKTSAKPLAELQMEVDALRYRSSPGLRSGELLTGMMLDATARMTAQLTRLNGLLAPREAAAADQPEEAVAARGSVRR